MVLKRYCACTTLILSYDDDDDDYDDNYMSMALPFEVGRANKARGFRSADCPRPQENLRIRVRVRTPLLRISDRSPNYGINWNAYYCTRNMALSNARLPIVSFQLILHMNALHSTLLSKNSTIIIIKQRGVSVTSRQHRNII